MQGPPAVQWSLATGELINRMETFQSFFIFLVHEHATIIDVNKTALNSKLKVKLNYFSITTEKCRCYTFQMSYTISHWVVTAKADALNTTLLHPFYPMIL